MLCQIREAVTVKQLEMSSLEVQHIINILNDSVDVMISNLTSPILYNYLMGRCKMQCGENTTSEQAKVA